MIQAKHPETKLDTVAWDAEGSDPVAYCLGEPTSIRVMLTGPRIAHPNLGKVYANKTVHRGRPLPMSRAIARAKRATA
jgi:hypothetical protein